MAAKISSIMKMDEQTVLYHNLMISTALRTMSYMESCIGRDKRKNISVKEYTNNLKHRFCFFDIKSEFSGHTYPNSAAFITTYVFSYNTD